MKFAILLLFSPYVVSSFTSICPQQPNSVVVNCNNANPFANPFGTPVVPGRVTGRLLDVVYNRPSTRSQLQFQLQRSDSSEESGESDESSEELHGHRIPLAVVATHPQIPSIHSTTTVNNRLDFINSRRRGLPAVRINNLRSIPRNHIPGHVTSTSDFGISETVRPDETTIVDETHGHGHSGQYNHAIEQVYGHGHQHGPHHGHEHGSRHGHEHGSRHGHEHGSHHGHDPNHGNFPDHVSSQFPSHIVIPTHITHPTTTISGAHIIPEQIIPYGTGDVVLNNQGHVFFDRGDQRNDGTTFQVTGVNPMLVPTTVGQYLLQDTHDRLILTRRGFRAINSPFETRGTYELYPQDLLNRVIATLPVPTVVQDGFNTEINCDHIPIVSEIPQPEVTQGAAQQAILSTSNVPSSLQSTSTSAVSATEVLPGSTAVISTETVNGHNKIPVTQGQSTLTTITTTNDGERPLSTDTRIPVGETITLGTQTGSTVTKVTTTKVEGRPITTDVITPTETIVRERPVQTGSTVTKVTTTTVEERPTVPAVETIVHGMPTQTGSTVTKVTTTKVEGRPVTTQFTIPTETIVRETPVETGSTITKVTTTNVEERPMSTDVIPGFETIVRETPVETGSTITKVTTTNVEERPMSTDVIPGFETIVRDTPVRTGSTVTKVTTTTTEHRPTDVISETETLLPTLPATDVAGRTKVIDETVNVEEVPLLKLVRPIRDETYRYDSNRQRMGPLVYRV